MAAYDPERITFFAKTDARGQQVPFGIKAKDRQRHMYVIGKTGMGKSTLLENMAAQDLKNGEGLAFIDPHGSAIEVLLDYVPEDRLDDVVYFAPFDMDNPIAFNIMEDVGPDTRHLVVSGLMSTFKKIWEDAWSARMEYILTNALLALIEYPDTTLLSVNRMLADKVYRDKVIENVKDPAVKAYWIDEFNNYTERFAAEALPAIQNKIGQFTGNPLIRNIIGQPKSSFDVRKMMDERKILLINLSKGLVGETNADLIGSMLITKIYLAAMSRAELPPAQMKMMPNFYFYVDEFQSFANSTFANILSEARKYHLNLIIAHQYVAQMEEKIRDAVFGNVGTTISFRVGPFDAEVLETVFAPRFEATDLVNLGFSQIYLSLMIDGVGSQPFSAVTLPPVQTPPKSHKLMAIKRSQQNYSKPRSEVEQLVIDSHSPDERLETAVENGSGNKGGFTKPSAFFKVGTEQTKKPKNGNGKPNGNGNKNGNGNGNTPGKENYTKKPKQPEKTPEDLRNILAQMSGTNVDKKTDDAKQTQTQSENSVEKPVKKNSSTSQTFAEKLEYAKQHNEVTAPPTSSQVDSRVKTESTDTPNAQSVEQPEDKKQKGKQSVQTDSTTASPDQSQVTDDLQSILKKLTAKTEELQNVSSTAHSNAPLTEKRQQVEKKPAHKKGVTKYPSQTPEELQTVLRKMVANTPKKSNVVQKTEPNIETQSQSPSTKKVSGDLQSALAEAVEKSVSTNVSPTTEQTVKQSLEPAVGGSRQPAFVPVQPSEQPDLAIAKKMLKTSGKERPPGM